MANRGVLNLALLGVALLIGLIIYLKPGLESADSALPVTTQLVPEEATGIHIERIKRDPISFIKRDEHWYLVMEQQELRASEFQIHALLRLLQTTSISRYAADSVALESLGLEPPQASVTIDDVVIHFGDTNPLEGKRYVQTDKTVHLIEDSYQYLINAGWTNFVARKLVPENSFIVSLQLPDISLTRADNNQWRLSPEKPNVSPEAIRQLLDHWSNARALYARRYDGRKSDDRITLEFSNSPDTLSFMIISRHPEMILAMPDRGIQYHLTSNMETALLTLDTPEHDQ